MIRSCEDVRTTAEFYEFTRSYRKTRKLGLKETARMLCWDDRSIIGPKLLVTLKERDRKINV